MGHPWFGRCVFGADFLNWSGWRVCWSFGDLKIAENAVLLVLHDDEGGLWCWGGAVELEAI